ncbi:uncharacterized protein LOC129717825 [Wyeomyia smithii]|uniref:uncharacterized protein LOC129717825 n=1 Tax=Wyeomyia smithii TaxID=174621 RepID=UPI002467F149|nr:uncharacterized protein LOC129717825 [Wyeomyia smithii]
MMVIRHGSDVEEDLSSDAPDSPQARNRQTNERNGEEFARFLFERGTLYFNLIYMYANNLIVRYHVKEIGISIYEALRRHPLLAVGIATGMFIITLPFMLFVFFTLATAIMTFTGFVLIEGTLITVASMLLVGVLLCVFSLLAFMGLVFLAGYFGLSRAYDCLDRWNGLGNERYRVSSND